MKKLLRGLLIAVLALDAVWIMGRYGWRLFGFNACGGSGIHAVTVSENEVTVEGYCPELFPSGCVGTISKVENGTVYIGVRYDGFFGFFESGQFSVTVPVEEDIQTVILKTSRDEYLIWDKEGSWEGDYFQTTEQKSA